jgi:hypothetical protein
MRRLRDENTLGVGGILCLFCLEKFTPSHPLLAGKGYLSSKEEKRVVRLSIKSGNIELFKKFSNFESIKDFNTSIEMWLVDYKAKFSKSELIGLKRLVRFSAKVPGVCNAKIGTILKAIYEEYGESGISRSSFKRMILKAKAFGMINVHEMERKNGSQSSNLYVFNRYPAPLQPIAELPKEEILDHPKETSIPLETTDNIKINKRIDDRLDSTFTNDRVPHDFTKTVKGFFNEAKLIEEYWHMAKLAAFRQNREKEEEQCLHLAIHSFKQMIGKYKKDKVKNPIAYFYGILYQKFQELYFEELFEMGF